MLLRHRVKHAATCRGCTMTFDPEYSVVLDTTTGESFCSFTCVRMIRELPPLSPYQPELEPEID